ncbi:MAG: Asp-tRNA(Asn)/Glu-tRNA(Gln) amidotransferase subunit GatC, partial [Candidatus Aenigmatarchaeota archaeon]
MDIEKIARLARLKLTDEEKMKFEKDLAEILEAFRVLDEMKTKERPALHPIDIKNELRADEAEPGLT